MTGDEYDGKVNSGFGQFGLKIQPAQSRQPHIHHEANGSVGKFFFEKLRHRTERFNIETYRPKETGERLAHLQIVVDYIDDPLCFQRLFQFRALRFAAEGICRRIPKTSNVIPLSESSGVRAGMPIQMGRRPIKAATAMNPDNGSAVRKLQTCTAIHDALHIRFRKDGTRRHTIVPTLLRVD
jgi:hypothetical protein